MTLYCNKTDEELEHDIAKFVNDTRRFQSRHKQKQQKKLIESRKHNIALMSDDILVFHIYHRKKGTIHRSYRKAFYQHLKQLPRTELIKLMHQDVQGVQSDGNSKELHKIEQQIKQKIRN